METGAKRRLGISCVSPQCEVNPTKENWVEIMKFFRGHCSGRSDSVRGVFDSVRGAMLVRAANVAVELVGALAARDGP